MQFKDVGETAKTTTPPPPPPPPADQGQHASQSTNDSSTQQTTWNSGDGAWSSDNQAWGSSTATDWTTDVSMEVVFIFILLEYCCLFVHS